jgi:hypothetical protein
MAGNALVDYATEHLLYAKAAGYAPHACVCIPFGDVDKPDNVFPAQEYGKVDLKLTGESGAGAIRVVYQQVRM